MNEVNKSAQPQDPSGSRAQSWASTMHGFNSPDGIIFAHADSWAGAGSTNIVSRAEREAREDAQLAPLATRAFGAGNRAITEQADDYRTCFERDRDRILQASAFR